MDICKKYVELHDKIKNIKIAMMTVHQENGHLRSFPMTTMQMECEGNVWFFTDSEYDKVSEIKHNPYVNLSYSDHSNGIFVSVAGKAEIIHNVEKMHQLWKPVLEEWFPGGVNDNNLTLVKVEMMQAEYWNGDRMVEIWDSTNVVKVENESLYDESD